MVPEQCAICSEPITNPICVSCLEDETNTWALDYGLELHNALPQVETENKTTCLRCKHTIDICPHCYSYQVLEDVKIQNPILAETFREQFDFDLRYTK